MSTVQEVEQALQQMTPGERNRVRAFLLHWGRVDTAAYRTEMGRRLRRMRRGRKVTQAQVEKRHAELSRKGR
jgi:hypothetical protein